MLQNPAELPNCQPKVEKMVKGIQWLYPDVENAVHVPRLRPHSAGFGQLRGPAMAAQLSFAQAGTVTGQGEGKSIFWLGIRILQER